MADFNNFINSETLKEKFILSLKKLDTRVNELKSIYSETMGVVPDNTYHSLTLAFKTDDRFDKILWSHILDTAYQAELKAAGSAFVSIKTFCCFGQWLLKTNNFNKQEVNNFLGLFLDDCKNNSSVIKEEKLYEVLTKNLNPTLAAITKEALVLNGTNSNISIEKNNSFHYEVELRNGYNFPVKTINSFLDKTTFEWKRQNVKILVIDGFIETIGEIETLTYELNKTKEPLLIVSQGFEPEVLSFLTVNNRKKLIDVCLITVDPSMESVNLINDIATAAGAELISVVNGDLVSTVRLNNLICVNKLIAGSTFLSFTQNNTKSAVNLRIEDLVRRKDEMANSDNVYNFTDFFIKRIKNLIGQSVVIKLPELSKGQLLNEKTQLDIVLRECKTLLDFGLIDLSNIELKYGLEALKTDLPENLSHLSFAVGVWMAVKKAMEVLTVSGAIVLD